MTGAFDFYADFEMVHGTPFAMLAYRLFGRPPLPLLPRGVPACVDLDASIH